jgi:hypothetical protein
VRCAIYTRVSTESGLDQDFNSLDAQYDAAQAHIRSQAHAGWTLVRTRYDDGGFSGGTTDRPALQQLLDDIRGHRINVIVVYKVDRLTRSLADFAKLVELFDAGCLSCRSRSSSTPRPRWAGCPHCCVSSSQRVSLRPCFRPQNQRGSKPRAGLAAARRSQRPKPHARFQGGLQARSMS